MRLEKDFPYFYTAMTAVEPKLDAVVKTAEFKSGYKEMSESVEAYINLEVSDEELSALYYTNRDEYNRLKLLRKHPIYQIRSMPISNKKWGMWFRAVEYSIENKDYKTLNHIKYATGPVNELCGLEYYTDPSNMRNSIFENYNTELEDDTTNLRKRVLSALKDRATNPLDKINFIVMTGGPGTGKTHLGLSYINTVWHRDPSSTFNPLYVLQQDMMQYIRSSEKINLATEKGFTIKNKKADAINFYSNVDFLLLDEVGREGISNYSENEKNTIRSSFFKIINHRYISNKPTILISNHNEDGLKEYFGGNAGAALVDRLYDINNLVIDMSSLRSYRRGNSNIISSKLPEDSI